MEAAREAFPAWSSRSPQERSLVLNRLADVLEQSLEELAQAESKDQGDGSPWQGLSATQDLLPTGVGFEHMCVLPDAYGSCCALLRYWIRELPS